MQPKITRRRLDLHQPGAIAHRDIEKPAVPAEILGPGIARDPLHRGVAVAVVTGFPPGLEAERGNTEFGTRQSLWRAQHGHPRGVAPDSRARFALGQVDHRYRADPSTAQGKREGAAVLAGTNDDDVVVDGSAIGAGARRHPVLRIGADQPQRLARRGVTIIRIGGLGHAILSPIVSLRA